MADLGFIYKTTDLHYELQAVGQQCVRVERYDVPCPPDDPPPPDNGGEGPPPPPNESPGEPEIITIPGLPGLFICPPPPGVPLPPGMIPVAPEWACK